MRLNEYIEDDENVSDEKLDQLWEDNLKVYNVLANQIENSQYAEIEWGDLRTFGEMKMYIDDPDDIAWNNGILECIINCSLKLVNCPQNIYDKIITKLKEHDLYNSSFVKDTLDLRLGAFIDSEEDEETVSGVLECLTEIGEICDAFFDYFYETKQSAEEYYENIFNNVQTYDEKLANVENGKLVPVTGRSFLDGLYCTLYINPTNFTFVDLDYFDLEHKDFKHPNITITLEFSTFFENTQENIYDSTTVKALKQVIKNNLDCTYGWSEEQEGTVQLDIILDKLSDVDIVNNTQLWESLENLLSIQEI